MQVESLNKLVNSSAVNSILPFLVFMLMQASLYLIFLVAPEEQVMGAVQKVFYYHVASAITAYVLIGILFIASVFYLLSRLEAWDYIADAASSVGLVFCTIVLVTGMIWGKSAWNTWWRWEPRLVSFLVLWTVLFSHRFLKWQQSSAIIAALLGIFAAVNVPIVVFSVKFLSQAQQLHPQVVAQQGLRSGWYVFTLIFSTVSIITFAFWLMILKTRLNLIYYKIRHG